MRNIWNRCAYILILQFVFVAARVVKHFDG